MSAEQTFSTSDLRGQAIDYKRDATQKHKWALGGTSPPDASSAKSVPVKVGKTRWRTDVRDLTRFRNSRKRAVNDACALEDDELVADLSTSPASSSDDNLPSNSNTTIAPTAALPSPDAGVMYSFDAARGPSHGSQILNSALAKAVQKFEEKETVKLVRNEYDVVSVDGESVETPAAFVGKRAKAKEAKAARAADEEEYEFV